MTFFIFSNSLKKKKFLLHFFFFKEFENIKKVICFLFFGKKKKANDFVFFYKKSTALLFLSKKGHRFYKKRHHPPGHRTSPHRQDFVQAEDKVPADDIVECRDEVQPQSGEVVWCGAPHHTALRTSALQRRGHLHPLFHFVDGRRDADICFAEDCDFLNKPRSL
jgi:hypothetical protein